MAQAVDGAMIWGGQEAVLSVRSLPFPHWAKLAVFGPRLSVAAMDAGAWSNEAEQESWCQRIARDVWQFDQQACSSPQALFLERRAGCPVAGFVSVLERAFRTENRQHPRQAISPTLTSAICRARASWLLADTSRRAIFPSGPDWTLLLGSGAALPEPVQGKTLHILEVDNLLEPVGRFDGNVQTLGLAMADAGREAELAALAGKRGVDRVVKLGRMHLFVPPWDGMDLVRPDGAHGAPRAVGRVKLIERENQNPMNAESFLLSMDKHAKMFAPGARATCAANPDLCRWLLDPLAKWAHAAYGDQAFDDAAKGYARYCLGVWKAQQLYEKAGRYTPQDLPDIVSAVYEDAGYMVPYMWAAILIYPFWPSVVRHIAMYRDDFLKELPPEANIMELASGHGVMSLLAAEHRPDIHSHGLDISPPAVEIAHRLLKVSGHGDRVKFEVKDALTLSAAGSGRNYQGIIAAMLAEHLRPQTAPQSHRPLPRR